MNGAPAATVRIEAHWGSMPYSRMILGQFRECCHRQVHGGAVEPGSPLSDGRGFRLDAIEAPHSVTVVGLERTPGGRA